MRRIRLASLIAAVLFYSCAGASAQRTATRALPVVWVFATGGTIAGQAAR